MLVEIERELHLGHKEAGALFLVITIGYSAALLGSGTLAARLTHRQLIVGSTLGLGMFLLLLSRPQPLWC